MRSNLFTDEMLWICFCGYVVTDTQDTIILVFLSQTKHILCYPLFAVNSSHDWYKHVVAAFLNP